MRSSICIKSASRVRARYFLPASSKRVALKHLRILLKSSFEIPFGINSVHDSSLIFRVKLSTVSSSLGSPASAPPYISKGIRSAIPRILVIRFLNSSRSSFAFSRRAIRSASAFSQSSRSPSDMASHLALNSTSFFSFSSAIFLASAFFWRIFSSQSARCSSVMWLRSTVSFASLRFSSGALPPFSPI